jgi:hypothetical protein
MTVLPADREVDFSVSYEGPAFTNQTMEVRELAPALLSLGQAFDRANFLLNGDRAKVTLSIRATQPGSFEVLLFLEQLLEGASGALSGDFLASAANLVTVLVGVSGVSLFGVFKRLRNRKPTISEDRGDGILFEADNVRFCVPTEVARLYRDRHIRDQVEAFVRPLLREGVERVVFKRGQAEIESVRRDEAQYFRAEDADANVTEYVIPRQRLQITSLTFRDGKWRLSDGANTHWYAMEDREFAQEIQQGKRFGKDHILVCEVLLTQRLEDDGKLRLDYSVQRVLEHITPGRQLQFGNSSPVSNWLTRHMVTFQP